MLNCNLICNATNLIWAIRKCWILDKSLLRRRFKIYRGQRHWLSSIDGARVAMLLISFRQRQRLSEICARVSFTLHCRCRHKKMSFGFLCLFIFSQIFAFRASGKEWNGIFRSNTRVEIATEFVTTTKQL